MHKGKVVLAAVAATFLLTACEIDDRTRDRVLTGTAIGATGGAVVGGLGSGTILGGAAIGAAAGAAGTFVGDQIDRALDD